MALKYLLTVACALMIFIEQAMTSHHECVKIPGCLKQIDAGVGMVIGVKENGSFYGISGNSLIMLPGDFKHVTVGPAGIWGVDYGNNTFNLEGAEWIPVIGHLMQVDAGGDQFAVGVDCHDNAYCMNRDRVVRKNSPVPPGPWNQIPGALVYQSCGLFTCWGVNENQDIFMRTGVSPNECANAVDWKLISGKLVMVEVGTDGSVYGVNAEGVICRRDGITECNLEGTRWTPLREYGKSKHVSYDLGYLWIITMDDKILKCPI